VKREVLERSTAELAATRAASDDARYELARHLNTVSGSAKHHCRTQRLWLKHSAACRACSPVAVQLCWCDCRHQRGAGCELEK